LVCLSIKKTKIKLELGGFGPDCVTLNWIDQEGKKKTEGPIRGYVLKDEDNKTLEFRLAVTLDLTDINQNEIEIFFAEGTGYAEWMTENNLRKFAELNMVTPFLNKLLFED